MAVARELLGVAQNDKMRIIIRERIQMEYAVHWQSAVEMAVITLARNFLCMQMQGVFHAQIVSTPASMANIIVNQTSE